MLLVAFATCLLGLSYEAIGQPFTTTQAPIYEHIKHISLGDTHLIQLGDNQYVILNPPIVEEPFSAFTMEEDNFESRQPGQIFGGFLPKHYDYEGLDEADDLIENLRVLSINPSKLKPADRFISIEYPLDGSTPRVIASQNYDSMEVRGAVNATVVYDNEQYSVFNEELQDWTHDRLFWVGGFLVISRVEPNQRFLHSIHSDFVRDVDRIDVDRIATKVLQGNNK